MLFAVDQSILDICGYSLRDPIHIFLHDHFVKLVHDNFYQRILLRNLTYLMEADDEEVKYQEDEKLVNDAIDIIQEGIKELQCIGSSVAVELKQQSMALEYLDKCVELKSANSFQKKSRRLLSGSFGPFAKMEKSNFSFVLSIFVNNIYFFYHFLFLK